MSIEMWFINNSNNALSQDNKTAEIGFIGRSPNYIAVSENKDKLRNRRAYVETF